MRERNRGGQIFYICPRIEDLDKVALETPIKGLRLIAGALGHTGMLETRPEQRSEFLARVRDLPAELVIIDCAAGTDRSTLDFFLQADGNVLVTTPEPTAVSCRMRKGPTSPVCARCVPPQSSREKSSMLTTRTVSPYFSPNSAMAPVATASA